MIDELLKRIARDIETLGLRTEAGDRAGEVKCPGCSMQFRYSYTVGTATLTGHCLSCDASWWMSEVAHGLEIIEEAAG